MNQELRVRTRDGNVNTVKLEKDSYTVGRAGVCDLCYADDPGLSRVHVAIERLGGDWSVRDLGSRNGTSLNGKRLENTVLLRPGDRVTAGHLSIEYADPFAGGMTVVFTESGGFPVSPATMVASLDDLLGPEISQKGVASNSAALSGTRQVDALIRAGRELASHTPLAELFPTILELAIDAVNAGRGVLMTLDGGDLVVRAAKGEGFTISKTVRDRVLKDKESLLVRDVQSDAGLRGQMSIIDARVMSMMAVPLQTNDQNVIGLIYVDSATRMREFNSADLSLLTVMANVAAIRIDHARLAEVEQQERMTAKELQQAGDIQRRLLPTVVPEEPTLEIAAFHVPCRTVGGDYYDFFRRSDGSLVLIVADVAGKGMPAALIMSSLQSKVHVLFEDFQDMAATVTRLNRLMKENCPDNRFITFFASVYDPKTGQLIYSNAGHNPPLVIRRSGEVVKLKDGGMLLGLLAKSSYTAHSVQLEDGDVLALFTDGVSEAEKPGTDEEFGEKRIIDLIVEHRDASSAAILETIKQSVGEFSSTNVSAADDFTLMIAKRHPTG
jgi:sigma-B regulation protein RsbU (phosphoserine phosphatase)